MIIAEFNKEQFAADAKQAILDRDINRLKELKAGFNKRTIVIETSKELERYEQSDSDNVIFEPKFYNWIEMLYFQECIAGRDPDWSYLNLLNFDMRPEEIREIHNILEAEY
jgi:hypothetical protein